MNNKHPINKFTYKSILTAEYIMPHQWVGEVLVKRKADFEKKDLPYKFWKDSNSIWTKELKKQISKAAQLFKKYSEEAVLNFLKNYPYKFSLMTKSNMELIKLEQEKIDNRQEFIQLDIQEANDYIVRKNYKKNMLGKLK